MGPLYVDRIPTYKKVIKTQAKSSALKDAGYTKYRWNDTYSYVKDVNMKSPAKKHDGSEGTYKVFTNDNDDGSVAIDTVGNDTTVLQAKDLATDYYNDNYDDIDFSRLAYYTFSEVNSEDANAGDDCVRFAFSCFNRMNSNFMDDFKTYSGYSYKDITSHYIAGTLSVDNNILLKNNPNYKVAYALYQLGFEIYDFDISKTGSFDFNNDGKNDLIINTFPSDFKLEATDFVAYGGHVHFCLEDDSVGNVKKNFG